MQSLSTPTMTMSTILSITPDECWKTPPPMRGAGLHSGRIWQAFFLNAAEQRLSPGSGSDSAISTAREEVSGRHAHHRCNFKGYPCGINFSRAVGIATSAMGSPRRRAAGGQWPSGIQRHTLSSRLMDEPVAFLIGDQDLNSGHGANLSLTKVRVWILHILFGTINPLKERSTADRIAGNDRRAVSWKGATASLRGSASAWKLTSQTI